MFNLVYDVDVVNELSFYRWRDKGTERFGRGNAVISVKTFFDWLENAETESEGEGEEGGEMRWDACSLLEQLLSSFTWLVPILCL